jgi:hypothetical protein
MGCHASLSFAGQTRELPNVVARCDAIGKMQAAQAGVFAFVMTLLNTMCPYPEWLHALACIRWLLNKGVKESMPEWSEAAWELDRAA